VNANCFNAPWGKTLRWILALSVVNILGAVLPAGLVKKPAWAQWSLLLPVAGLQAAEAVPGAMRGSLRLCGNGGLFSITGWYRNRALGNYRAFVTDLKRTVVLRFPARTVVVSPENPERFVAEISQFAFRTT
jgi:hypothetical protein